MPILKKIKEAFNGKTDVAVGNMFTSRNGGDIKDVVGEVYADDFGKEAPCKKKKH
jgi:hypothetical protein